MGKKRRHKEREKEQAQQHQGLEQTNNCFQNIICLIIMLVILDFICKAMAEK